MLTAKQKIKRIDQIIEVLLENRESKENKTYYVCWIYDILLTGKHIVHLHQGESQIEKDIPEVDLIKRNSFSHTWLSDLLIDPAFHRIEQVTESVDVKIIALELLKQLILNP